MVHYFTYVKKRDRCLSPYEGGLVTTIERDGMGFFLFAVMSSRSAVFVTSARPRQSARGVSYLYIVFK